MGLTQHCHPCSPEVVDHYAICHLTPDHSDAVASALALALQDHRSIRENPFTNLKISNVYNMLTLPSPGLHSW